MTHDPYPEWFAVHPHDEPADNGDVRPLIRELEVLRVKPDENLIIRIDPRLEDEYPGFLADMNTALVQAGFGGRAFIVALEPRHADIVVVPRADA